MIDIRELDGAELAQVEGGDAVEIGVMAGIVAAGALFGVGYAIGYYVVGPALFGSDS